MGREKTFMEKFYNKADKAHEKAGQCYKNDGYRGFLNAWIEENYFEALGHAVYGDESTVIDMRDRMNAENNRFKVHKSLKKLGKEEKILEVEAAINRFIDEISDDFLTLAKQSAEIKRMIDSMSLGEKMERPDIFGSGISIGQSKNRLLMEDAAFMVILNKLKAQSNVTKLQKEIGKILEKPCYEKNSKNT
jgi:hypothetical protein